jgi:hypothetical protein
MKGRNVWFGGSMLSSKGRVQGAERPEAAQRQFTLRSTIANRRSAIGSVLPRGVGIGCQQSPGFFGIHVENVPLADQLPLDQRTPDHGLQCLDIGGNVGPGSAPDYDNYIAQCHDSADVDTICWKRVEVGSPGSPHHVAAVLRDARAVDKSVVLGHEVNQAVQITLVDLVHEFEGVVASFGQEGLLSGRSQCVTGSHIMLQVIGYCTPCSQQLGDDMTVSAGPADAADWSEKQVGRTLVTIFTRPDLALTMLNTYCGAATDCRSRPLGDQTCSWSRRDTPVVA